MAGGNNSLVKRFALFDTTEFIVPSFARVGQRPNLAATSGTGFPYNSAEIPVPLLVGTEPESLSAATTLMARLSVAAGRRFRSNRWSMRARSATATQSLSALSGSCRPACCPRSACRRIAARHGGRRRPMPDGTRRPTPRKPSIAGATSSRGAAGAARSACSRTGSIQLRYLPQHAQGGARPGGQFRSAGQRQPLLAQGTSPGAGGTWLVATGTSPKELEQSMRALTQRREWARSAGVWRPMKS